MGLCTQNTPINIIVCSPVLYKICNLHKWLSLFTGLDYWTGILDWNTGLDYWTEVVSFFGQGFMILVYFQIFEETYNNQCI